LHRNIVELLTLLFVVGMESLNDYIMLALTENGQ